MERIENTPKKEVIGASLRKREDNKAVENRELKKSSM